MILFRTCGSLILSNPVLEWSLQGSNCLCAFTTVCGLRTVLSRFILDCGFMYVLVIVQSLEAASNTVCSNNVRYIESVRDKQNKYGDTVSTLVDLTFIIGIPFLAIRSSIL